MHASPSRTGSQTRVALVLALSPCPSVRQSVQLMSALSASCSADAMPSLLPLVPACDRTGWDGCVGLADPLAWWALPVPGAAAATMQLHLHLVAGARAPGRGQALGTVHYTDRYRVAGQQEETYLTSVKMDILRTMVPSHPRLQCKFCSIPRRR